MLRYFYTLNYDDGAQMTSSSSNYPDWNGVDHDAPEPPSSEKTTANTTSPLLLNIEIFTLADKYAIRGLAELSLTKFRAILEYKWDTTVFLSTIAPAYENTPDSVRGLRDVIVEYARRYLDLILETEDKALEGVVEAVPSFAMALLRKANRPAEFSVCKVCRKKDKKASTRNGF